MDASGQSCLLCKRDRLKRLLREGGGGVDDNIPPSGRKKARKTKSPYFVLLLQSRSKRTARETSVFQKPVTKRRNSFRGNAKEKA